MAKKNTDLTSVTRIGILNVDADGSITVESEDATFDMAQELTKLNGTPVEFVVKSEIEL